MRARLAIVALVLFVASTSRADAVSDAATLFRAGVERFDRKDFAGALEAFEQSRALHATKSALENIAACLVRLERFEEALVAYEELSDAAEVASLTRYTGFVRVRSTAGARVFVDGRERTPVADAPLRVTVGSRRVRVEKEGFASFETTVTVASGETRDVLAELAVIVEVGRMRVTCASGCAMDVRVDGAPVGRTPWEGAVSAGEHTVALVGEGDTGTLARAVHVATGRTEHVELAPAPLPAVIRVEPSPTDANVSMDGRVVSRGTWASSAPSGAHAIDVSAPWYLPYHADVMLTSRAPTELRVVLDPIHRLSMQLFAGPIFLPTYDAPANRGCTSCVGYLLGGRVSFSFTRRFAGEIFFVPSTNIVNSATWDATVFLSFGGFSGKLEFFDRTPLTLRLWAGFGSVAVAGTGAWTAVAAPEVRFGYRVSKTIVVDVGVAVFAFSVPQTAGYVLAEDGLPRHITNGGFGLAVPVTGGLRADL